MSVTEFKRGVPTYKDKDDNEFGLLCETKEVCVTDNDGVSLEYKIQNLLSEINRLTSELQSCASEADLANYFPKSGGTINGSITIGEDSAEANRYFVMANNKRKVNMSLEKGGDFSLYDNTNSRHIIRSSANGTNTFNGTASGNLPLVGGVIGDGNDHYPLVIKGNDSKRVSIGFRDGSNNALGYLGMIGTDNLTFFTSDSKGLGAGNTILHTGNSAKVVVSETAPSDTSALWVW